MERNGHYSNALGENARSEKFNLRDLPPSAAGAYKALRAAQKAIRSAKAEAEQKVQSIEANADLTHEAKRRRVLEVREEASKAIRSAVLDFETERERFGRRATEVVRSEQGRNPLDGVDGPGLLRMLVSAMARDRIERQVDQALAADKGRTGAPLQRLYQEILASKDRLALYTFESMVPARLDATGSEAQKAVIGTLVKAVREERVGDAGRLALDHVDALNTASTLLSQADTTPKLVDELDAMFEGLEA